MRIVRTDDRPDTGPIPQQADSRDNADTTAATDNTVDSVTTVDTDSTEPERTVLLCDDNPEIRKSLLMVLNELPRFRVIGEADNGTDCLELIRQRRPNLIILDVSMPGGGPAVARAARELDPELHIIVYSGRNDRSTQSAMLEAGADEYVVKSGRLRPMMDALDRAFAS